MDYSSYTQEQLLRRIAELEMLNKELLREREAETRLDFAWTGNLGHWYWNIVENTVVFNPLKITALGYTMDEIPEIVPYQFFTDLLHKEDYDTTMEAMRQHIYGKKKVYEAEYRLKTKNGTWKWFYDRGKITQRDESGRPLFASGIVFDITDNKLQQIDMQKTNEILRQRSETDTLTGIKNRQAIMDELDSRMIRASMEKTPLSIVMMDIDHFKAINDTKGHLMGDAVLIKIADIIVSMLRDTDTVGRYGGEEFLIVLPNTDLMNARHVAERIREKVAEEAFEGGIKMTISGGVKEYGGEEKADFLDAADKNLYEAKNSGRNRIIG